MNQSEICARILVISVEILSNNLKPKNPLHQGHIQLTRFGGCTISNPVQ